MPGRLPESGGEALAGQICLAAASGHVPSPLRLADSAGNN